MATRIKTNKNKWSIRNGKSIDRRYHGQAQMTTNDGQQEDVNRNLDNIMSKRKRTKRHKHWSVRKRKSKDRQSTAKRRRSKDE